MRIYSPSAEVQGHGPGQEVLQTGKREVELVDAASRSATTRSSRAFQRWPRHRHLLVGPALRPRRAAGRAVGRRTSGAWREAGVDRDAPMAAKAAAAAATVDTAAAATEHDIPDSLRGIRLEVNASGLTSDA